MGECRYVLAMYDIRGKQKFIFRKGKIQEVIGGSSVIRDLFHDYLYPVAEQFGKGIFQYKSQKNTNEKAVNIEKNKTEAAFGWTSFRGHLEEGYIGEVIYDGGGNFFVLYKNEEICRAINRRFTKTVMEETYTLKVLCSYVAIDPDENDFQKDRTRLYCKNRENEANESVSIPSTVLPFTQVDRQTSMPLTGVMRGQNYERQQVTVESRIKLQKFKQEKETEKKSEKRKNELILDRLVEEKGTSSLLAIIHIDGNNMGALFQDALGKSTSYEDCIAKLRSLSDVVQSVHIDRRKKDIDDLLIGLNSREEGGKKKHRRAVVSAGDDFTIICKAQDALDVTEEYLSELWADHEDDVKNKEGKPGQWSACAGIAIFHSHAPFADAYRIAESCCDSAKGIMKKLGLKNAELIDFEYLQSGIDMTLEKIREIIPEQVNSRPWIFRADAAAKRKIFEDRETIYTWLEDPFSSNVSETSGTNAEPGKEPSCLAVSSIVDIMKSIGHSNIKGLAAAALNGDTAFRLELERISAHGKHESEAGERKLLDTYNRYEGKDEKAFRSLIYDYVIFHDIWFAQREKKKNQAAEKEGAEDRASSEYSKEAPDV